MTAAFVLTAACLERAVMVGRKEDDCLVTDSEAFEWVKEDAESLVYTFNGAPQQHASFAAASNEPATSTGYRPDRNVSDLRRKGTNTILLLYA
jgi:hypothetical protein